MARSRVPTITHRGRDQIVSQILTAGQVWEHTITLPRSDFTHGFLLLMIPWSSGSASRRRTNANVYFTTAAAEAVSQATRRRYMGIQDHYGCTRQMPDWQHRAFFYDADGVLSEEYLSTADGSAGAGIRLNHCYIDGNLIRLEFENVHGTSNGTVKLDIEYRVEKVERG